MNLFQHIAHAYRTWRGPEVHWVNRVDMFEFKFMTACDQPILTNDPSHSEFLERDTRIEHITCKVCYKAKKGRGRQ